GYQIVKSDHRLSRCGEKKTQILGFEDLRRMMEDLLPFRMPARRSLDPDRCQQARLVRPLDERTHLQARLSFQMLQELQRINVSAMPVRGVDVPDADANARGAQLPAHVTGGDSRLGRG